MIFLKYLQGLVKYQLFEPISLLEQNKPVATEGKYSMLSQD